jgi:TIR domain
MNDPVQELWQVAPTLVELRKLPAAQKDRPFLAKLARMSRHDGSVLNKGNLMLNGDPYGFAKGFPDGEIQGVKEHLLGAPWTRLVNKGYLVDLNGQGFHKVSVEGHEFLAQSAEPVTVVVPPVAPPAVASAPRAFISYAWEGDGHQAWVTALAERLQGESGVEIIYDQWGLQPGADKQHFMEQSVRAQDFVIIICTETYADRANNRVGGVGIETNIITGEMADDLLSKKFIPVLRQGTFKASLPSYIKTKMGVDLSGNPYREAEYDRLIRVLHGEPIQGPPIAPKPDFSKKPEPKTKTFLQAAGEALAEQNAGTLLGPLKERPQAEFHAQYDKPGTPGPWVYALIRQWQISGEIKYSLETSQGDEFIGTKDDVIETFSKFNRKLIKEGYKRMSFMPGSDPDFQTL